MKQFDTSRPEFSPYGFACELWTPARMPRPDRHNEIELNLLTAGTLTYLLGGHRTTIEAAKVGVFWAAIPHQIVQFEGEAPYFVVTLPLSEFLRTGLDLNLVNRVLQGELLIDSAPEETDELVFQRWEQDLQDGAPTLERARDWRCRHACCDSHAGFPTCRRLVPHRCCLAQISWPATSRRTISSR